MPKKINRHLLDTMTSISNNVVFTIALAFLYYLSFITDIDYVEHTQRQKIFTFSAQLLVVNIPTITAIHLYKSNIVLLRKLALFGNWCGVVATIFYLIAIVYYQHINFYGWSFLITVFCYSVFALPFLINLKAIKINKYGTPRQ